VQQPNHRAGQEAFRRPARMTLSPYDIDETTFTRSEIMQARQLEPVPSR